MTYTEEEKQVLQNWAYTLPAKQVDAITALIRAVEPILRSDQSYTENEQHYLHEVLRASYEHCILELGGAL